MPELGERGGDSKPSVIISSNDEGERVISPVLRNSQYRSMCRLARRWANYETKGNTTKITSAGLFPTGGKGRGRVVNSRSRLTSGSPAPGEPSLARLRGAGRRPRRPLPLHSPRESTRSFPAGARRRRGVAGIKEGGWLTLRTYLMMLKR